MTSVANPVAEQDAEGLHRQAMEIAGLSKVFGEAVRAVDDVNLNVPPGQVFSLLGPNGAGKTTTIKMICGLVTPSAGSVRVNGFDIRRQRSHAVLQLGAVLEGGRNIYWSLTAWQNLFYFGRLKGLTGKEIKPRAERLLRELGLWEVRHSVVGGFSRGMQQKVAVASALITDPPILLLDEPTIGLDVEAARTVKDWIVRLAREEGKTVVLTTHQLAMAQELSDRVAVMRSGRIMADLPVQELLTRFREDRYRIVLGSTSASLDGIALPNGTSVAAQDGGTVLTLPTLESPQLYALLNRFNEAGLPLRAVSPIEPDLEEVFLQLVREGVANA